MHKSRMKTEAYGSDNYQSLLPSFSYINSYILRAIVLLKKLLKALLCWLITVA